VQETWRNLRRVLPLLLASFAALGVVGYLLFPIVIPLIFSQRYATAVSYARILWLAQCLTVAGTMFAMLLRAQQKKSVVYAEGVGYPLLMFGLNAWLVRYGIRGVVLAQVIVYVAHLVYMSIMMVWHVRHESAAGEPLVDADTPVES